MLHFHKKSLLIEYTKAKALVLDCMPSRPIKSCSGQRYLLCKGAHERLYFIATLEVKNY